MDEFISTMQRELESLKSSMMQALNKKADYNLLEQVKDTLHKKLDNDFFQTASAKLKTDC